MMIVIDEKRKELAEYINGYADKWDFYGVIQIRYQDKIIFENNYGYACLNFGIVNSLNTRFSLASITKQFTAFAIMLLYDQHLINLNNSANLYLPEYMHIPENITVHHLLCHTSGLYNNYGIGEDLFIDNDRKIYSQYEYFTEYILREPIIAPGITYDYNNSNYNLLAWIIEYVSGMKYERFLTKNIFKPLSMNNTEVDDDVKVIRNKAFTYSRDFHNYVKAPYYNEKFSIGAGGIISNCEDLYKWFCCLRDKRILTNEAYSRYLQVNSNSYCYGLQYSKAYGTEKYWHGGDHMGIGTYLQQFPEENLCIIILSNNESVDQYRLGDTIADMIHGVDIEPSEKMEELPMSEEEINKYCGTYLEGKLKIEYIHNKLYFSRFKDNLHIELYSVGKGRFLKRFCEQLRPYVLEDDDKGIPTFFKYKKRE
jgi:CubicO group peptidase (beta-lactamase class C family)